MRVLLLLVTIFCTLSVNAQNYLITFTGTGASTTVGSIKVENLTTGTSLTLNGTDILRLTGTTGVNPVENKQSSELKIYPNPTTGNSTVKIFPPVAGRATITVSEITGKPVAQYQTYLENNLQVFRLSGIKEGLFLINIKGNTYQFSGKLLCLGKNAGAINLEKISDDQTSYEKKPKSDNKGILATVDMAYSAGNRLKFTGISGNFTTIKTDIPTSDKTIIFNFIACTDGDNNNYPTVQIGTQSWMAENLKTTRYSNNDLIQYASTSDWSTATSGAFCYYNNLTSNLNTYGALYNFYAVEDPRNICPTGWHVPSRDDWTNLVTALGDSIIAGGKMKETGILHWNNPNVNATDESGLKILPGGLRYGGSLLYTFMGETAYLWSAEVHGLLGYGRKLLSYSQAIYIVNSYKTDGYSVRCVKNN